VQDGGAIVSKYLDVKELICAVWKMKDLLFIPWYGGVEKNTTSGHALYLPVRQGSQAGCEHGTPASIATLSPFGVGSGRDQRGFACRDLEILGGPYRVSIELHPRQLQRLPLRIHGPRRTIPKKIEFLEER